MLFSTIFLSACDGSNSTLVSSDASTDEAGPLLSGTVSTPKGISEQFISLKAPDGTVTETPIDEMGQFSLDNIQAGDRYLMRVNLGNDNYIYSFAHLPDASGNRQNIHSYTDLVARTWFADQGSDINSVFASGASIDNFPTHEAISAIDSNVQAIVSEVLQVYGLSDIRLSSVLYEASDTGIDRFLNENPVIIRDNRATIVVNDPNTNLQATAVDRVRLNTSFGEVDITPPEQPQTLRALGSINISTDSDLTTTSEQAIVLAWSIASDNIGVASYEIFRDDTLLDHTPFPLYRDLDIEPDSEYIYTVVTVDESGNRSIPSLQTAGKTLSDIDVTPPAIPSSATLNGNTDSIEVFWTHSDISDLARFEVTRTSDDGILVREVTGLRLSDLTVASGTEYCYTIVAVDASGNRSEPNPRACITTSGATIDVQTPEVVPVTVEMAQDSIAGFEGNVITAFVTRVSDAIGEVSIDYVITPGTATEEEDFIAPDGTLVWTDGDITAKRIDISLLPDGIVEGPETLSIVLSNSSTDAVISNAVTTVTIIDID